MLDQLMGTQRDGREGEEEDQIHFTDSVVCKSFLLGECFRVNWDVVFPLLGFFLYANQSVRERNSFFFFLPLKTSSPYRIKLYM